MKIIRVFPRRTRQTPDDNMAFIGYPPEGIRLPCNAVHVSVTFTWDKLRAERLAEAWGKIFANVELGGSAYGDPGGPFTPGMYLKRGVTITSRGCPNKCSFCYVPKREGKLRECQPIPEGHIVQDNNLLACSEQHFDAVCEMLSRQREIQFSGGFETTRLKDFHIHGLVNLRKQIKQVFFAYDRAVQYEPMRAAILRMRGAGFRQDQLRVYVLCGQKNDTLEKAESRMRQVVDAGAWPFAMLYCNDKGELNPSKQWHRFTRTWILPAAMKAHMKATMPLFAKE